MIIVGLVVIWLFGGTIIAFAMIRAGAVADERDREMMERHFHKLDDPRAVDILRGRDERK